jgi:methionyl aminopeptidase
MYEDYKKTKYGVPLHAEADFIKMEKAGKLAKEVLDFITNHVEVGVSTQKLDELCHDFILKNNAIPAPLGYRGYPKSICTSINSVICHGIPSENDILKNGDIVNIDITVILEGYYGDTSRMFFAGKPSLMAERLCKVTYDAMMLGIEKAKPGNKLRDIGIAIQNYAEKNGYSCVRDFCGHGIGKIFHMEPQVMHFNEAKNQYQDMTLEEGMFFTIEPMINAGKPQAIISKIDGWTATTKDKSLSAQYEHTIGLKNGGNIIFTS